MVVFEMLWVLPDFMVIQVLHFLSMVLFVLLMYILCLTKDLQELHRTLQPCTGFASSVLVYIYIYICIYVYIYIYIVTEVKLQITPHFIFKTFSIITMPHSVVCTNIIAHISNMFTLPFLKPFAWSFSNILSFINISKNHTWLQ